MRIEYTLTKRHVWQYHWYLWKRRLLIRLAKSFGLCLLVPALTFIPGVGAGFRAGIGNGFALSAAISLVMFTVSVVSLLLTMAYRFWKALKPTAVGERIAEIGKFDFCWGSPQRTLYHHHWAHFEDIADTKDALYFILAKHRALVVPTSAFSGSSEAARFVALAREHWEIARTNHRHASAAGEGVWPPPPRIGA